MSKYKQVCIGYHGHKWGIWVSTQWFRRYEKEKPSEQGLSYHCRGFHYAQLVISWLLVCSSNRIPLELDYRGNRGIIPWGVYYYYDSFVQEGKIYSYIWKWVFMVWKHNFEWISLEVESCLAEVWGKVPIGCQSPTLSHWRQLSYAVSSNRVHYWINIIFDWPLNRLNHKRGWNNKN